MCEPRNHGAVNPRRKNLLFGTSELARISILNISDFYLYREHGHEALWKREQSYDIVSTHTSAQA